MPIRVFVLDVGGCGACAAELQTAIQLAPELALANLPAAADVIAFTGTLSAVTAQLAATSLELHRADRPLVAIGRCTLEGSPYGRNGLSQWPALLINRTVDGCPPLPAAISAALIEVVK